MANAPTHSLVGSEEPIPFLDLAPSHGDLKDAILADIATLIDRGDFANGLEVKLFESAFAAYCGVSTCVGVASGLDAIRLVLLAAGISSGDEVIVPAHTFVATFEAVSQAGGLPVPVDIGRGDHNLDVDLIEAGLTDRTRFVLPVHLYGQMADMARLRDIAEKSRLMIVEDACQAHGATRDGVKAGSTSLAGAFSFYPGKNLGAFGDAGAVTSDDEELASTIRALREHGQRRKYHHDYEGWTSRLDTIQALVLGHKLEQLDAWNEARRACARFYDERLEGVGDLALPPVPPGSEPVWHLYVVRTSDPDALGAFLSGRGVATGRHYPVPPHLTDAYARLGYAEGAFPEAEALAREALSLPIFPGMTEQQLESVVGSVTDYFRVG